MARDPRRPLDDDHPIWERQRAETLRAFAAYAAYRDLPRAERSLSRLASDGSFGSRANVARWSFRWSWDARVSAWEDELERVRHKAMVEETIKMGRRQATHAQAFQTMLMQPTEELLRRVAQGDKLLAEAAPAALFDLGIRSARAFPRVALLERLARGAPTERIVTTGSLAQEQSDEERMAAVYAALEEAGLTLLIPQSGAENGAADLAVSNGGHRTNGSDPESDDDDG